METNQYPKNRTERDLHNEISAGDPVVLPLQVSLADSSWPFIGSLALHAALVALISSPVFQYPLSINSQSPAILWFSPMSPPDSGEQAEPSLLSGPRAAFAAQQEVSARESSLQPQAATADEVVADYHETAPERPADIVRPEMTVAAPLAVGKAAKAEKPQKPPPETPRRPAPPSAPLPIPAPVPSATPVPTPVPTPAAVPVPAPIPIPMPVQVKSVKAQVAELPLALPATPPAVAAVQDKPAPRQLKKEAEPQNPVKPVDKPVDKPVEKAMSVSLPLIKGDLKLVIAGAVLPDIAVTFIDFAASRRDRPLSRAESRRFLKVIPMIADARGNTREIVIARARPGVYTITAIPAGGAANVTLSLKLYEGTARSAARDLGRHTIADRKTLLKILMPEGIAWDDNTAFSGSMEDSDGVTKFNAETGLMWKEYSQ